MSILSKLCDWSLPKNTISFDWAHNLDGYLPPAPKGYAWYWRGNAVPTNERERYAHVGVKKGKMVGHVQLLKDDGGYWALGKFPPSPPLR